MTKPASGSHAQLLDTAFSRLLLTSAMMAEDIEQGLARRALTQARAKALWEIAHRQPTTQSELADVLNVTPRNVTALVDAMEKTGFVARTNHPTDRRATIVALTRKGRHAAARLKRDQQAFAQMLFADFSQADLKQFITTLDQIIERIGRAASTSTTEKPERRKRSA